MSNIMNQELKIVEFDAKLEYKNGKMWVKKLITNEIPVELTYDIIKAVNKTLLEYYKSKEENK